MITCCIFHPGTEKRNNCFCLLSTIYTFVTNMGELFRSREMTLCQLYLQTDSAYACVRELGELGKVHFRDVSDF